MPAESIRAAHSVLTEILGSSRLEEQLDGQITPSHAHSKAALCGLGAAYSAETGGEELNVSNSSPLCPTERTSMKGAGTSLMDQ
jgi:hypothetical protein